MFKGKYCIRRPFERWSFRAENLIRQQLGNKYSGAVVVFRLSSFLMRSNESIKGS